MSSPALRSRSRRDHSQMLLLGLERTLTDLEGRVKALESAVVLALETARSSVATLQSIIDQAKRDLVKGGIKRITNGMEDNP